jgi:hypothetical protein
MSERKYLVPEGMLRAAWHAQLPADNPTFEWDEGDEMSRKFYRRIMEAALRWMSENPIVPSETDAIILADVSLRAGDDRNKQVQAVATEWQRRMFLAPETPEEREMIVYECHNCKKSWKQQLREKVTSCVYCQSTNTESIATVSAVRDYPIAPGPEFPREDKSAFNSWWSSTNNQNWFSNKPITMRDLEETAYFAWRSAALSGKHICDSSEQEESAYMRVTKAMGAVTLSEEEGNKILEFVKGAIHAGYRSSEPSVPEAVNDLLVKHINSEGALNGPEHKASDARYAHNAAVLEAYRRGQKVGSRA